MIVALYILLALIVVGVILRLLHHPDTGAESDSAPVDSANDPEVCCGMHITCERDSLLSAVSDKIEYFDDDELDRFQGTDADAYTPSQIEEFRDVLLTLLPDDIAPWARSLQLRGIELPAPVRDELLLIVAETRQKRTDALQ